jgi:hypothetical protein
MKQMVLNVYDSLMYQSLVRSLVENALLLDHGKDYLTVHYIKEQIIDHLLKTGYPDYAAVLYAMRLQVHGAGKYMAHIALDGNFVELSASVFLFKDTSGAYMLRADWLDVVSLLLRHELLHRLLRHGSRTKKWWSRMMGM